MNEDLKKLLRDVFSVDTKAGYKIRYHITRALACEDYAKKIEFSPNPRGLIAVFAWKLTPEGYDYWRNIRNLSLYRDEYI
jgi:hypothetical protein